MKNNKIVYEVSFNGIGRYNRDINEEVGLYRLFDSLGDALVSFNVFRNFITSDTCNIVLESFTYNSSGSVCLSSVKTLLSSKIYDEEATIKDFEIKDIK